MRIRLIVAAMIAGLSVPASTLQHLTLEQMAKKSTEVVVGKAIQCSPELKGKLVYTTCLLNVAERWKSSPERNATSFSLPGGSVNGIHQQFSGVPDIQLNKDYVFFLWTGPSGMTQIIGLSQGALSIEKTSDGVPMAVRTPQGKSRMLNHQGKSVWDEGVDLPLSQLRNKVQRAMSK